MTNFIDLHNHTLPGVDDGADSWETAMAMLELAYRDGTRQIILTPHTTPDPHSASSEAIEAAFQQLQAQAKPRFPDLTLHLGGEVLYSSDLEQREAFPQLPRMAGSSYVLLEFLPSVSRRQLFNGVDVLLRWGYIPILAHTERYACLRTSVDTAAQLANAGALLQINADSVMGNWGRRVKWFCAALLRNRLAQFVASDAHGVTYRKPMLSACAATVARKYGQAYAQQLFRENPKNVIENCQM